MVLNFILRVQGEGKGKKKEGGRFNKIMVKRKGRWVGDGVVESAF